MPSQAHAGAAQEARNIGQWEGQDVPLVIPSSCIVKGGIPSSRRYLPTYLCIEQPCLCPRTPVVPPVDLQLPLPPPPPLSDLTCQSPPSSIRELPGSATACMSPPPIMRHLTLSNLRGTVNM